MRLPGFGRNSWLCFALLPALPAYSDVLKGDMLVQSNVDDDYVITEYMNDGTEVQTFLPLKAPDANDVGWRPRDLVVGADGQVYMFNGTFDPYLSIYDPMSETWSHRTHDGWSITNDGSYGGIAKYEDHVFVTNMAISGNPSQGVVAFNIPQNTSFEFATNLSPNDLNMGLDGKLWVLSFGEAHAFDPVTFAPLGMVDLVVQPDDIRGIAIDAAGHFYAARWDGQVAHYDSDGNLVDSLQLGGGIVTDIDVLPNGALLVGTRTEGVWLTDTEFSHPIQIQGGLEADTVRAFVTFIPEPASSTLMVLGILVACCRHRQRRRV